MAGLRTLLQLGGAGSGNLDYSTFHVFNTNKTTGQNGGFCCLWTAPAGVNWLAVELWGGGGGGAGACCCIQGWPGGSGSYARKIINNLSGSGGEAFTICAAGSTCCQTCQCCLGVFGSPSFVARNGGAVEVCASGGTRGGGACYYGSNCSYQGCRQMQCGSYIGGMGICGVTGSGKGSSYCYQSSWQWMPSAPFTPGGNRGSMSHCLLGSGCELGGFPHWPGGGGASAVSHDNPGCAGMFGAGGLVTIFYPTVVA